MKTLVKSYSYRPESSRLTILAEFKDSTKRNRMVFCSCDCGNFSYTTKSKVMQLKSRSCGCLSAERSANFGSNRKLDGNSAAINALIRTYKRSASLRGYTFDISVEDFLALTTMDCFYCGSKPSNKMERDKRNGGFTYNGLDRVDNALGYTINNVVPCCKICNGMKMDTSLDYFLKHVQKMIKYSENWYIP